MHDSLSVEGGWLGTYHYSSGDMPPERFEARFSRRSDGRFSGTILDDGALGEANVEGRQEGLLVQFIKQYVRPPVGYVTAPVLYEGALSEDGKLMSGQWSLKVRYLGVFKSTTMGSWHARRLWGEEREDESRPEDAVEALAIPAGR